MNLIRLTTVASVVAAICADAAPDPAKPAFKTFLYGTQYYPAPTPLPAEWEGDMQALTDNNIETLQLRLNWRQNEPREDEYVFDKYDGTRIGPKGEKVPPCSNGAFYTGVAAVLPESAGRGARGEVRPHDRRALSRAHVPVVLERLERAAVPSRRGVLLRRVPQGLRKLPEGQIRHDRRAQRLLRRQRGQLRAHCAAGFDDGTPAVQEIRFGKGRIDLLGFSLGHSVTNAGAIAAWRPVFDLLTKDAGLSTKAYADFEGDLDERRLFCGDEQYLFLINSSDDEKRVKLAERFDTTYGAGSVREDVAVVPSKACLILENTAGTVHGF